MKFLLTAINAKYIHSNLGIYSLSTYARQRLVQQGIANMQIKMAEYTINHRAEEILAGIYREKPDFIGFSCYIWNISLVQQLIGDLKQVLPQTAIFLGGPEVSYHWEGLFKTYPGITGILVGEGEESFARLVCALGEGDGLETGFRDIPGLVFRGQQGEIVETARPSLLSMDSIPFSYRDLQDLEHRIIYYESSRGCPFSCSYCLSSIDKTVRFRSLELVKRELDFFLEKRVPQVKFVDRTFNCRPQHAWEIWQYLCLHDNGITNFHFEISADLLDDQQLQVLSRMRPGLVQLEIGVQSTNEATITEIRRSMNLEKLAYGVSCVNRFSNIHQHLDLIAGLPWEDFDCFKRSFDQVYGMRPQQLQLGFLKVLKGSYMEEMAGEYDLCYSSRPPYQVLATRWLSYDQILELQDMEQMVEVYYNSGQFTGTMEQLCKAYESPFVLYQELAGVYREKGLFGVSHNRQARYQILYDFILERWPHQQSVFQDCLVVDLYLRENCKSRPEFARDLSLYKTEIRDFFIEEAERAVYLKGYEAYDSKQISKMAHVEVLHDGRWLLFDYRNKDPLTGNASLFTVRS